MNKYKHQDKWDGYNSSNKILKPKPVQCCLDLILPQHVIVFVKIDSDYMAFWLNKDMC